VAANTWTKIRINIPGDTAGTWNVAGNASAAVLIFSICVGSTYQIAPNVWTAGSFSAPTGAANIAATLNAQLNITGVALMVGAAAQNAEPDFRKYSDNLLDCQRYFWKALSGNPVNLVIFAYAPAAGYTTAVYWSAPVVMRAAPTLVAAWGSGSNANAAGNSILADNRTVGSSINSVAAGGYAATWSITSLDADF
jgi:hypothetical protein